VVRRLAVGRETGGEDLPASKRERVIARNPGLASARPLDQQSRDRERRDEERRESGLPEPPPGRPRPPERVRAVGRSREAERQVARRLEAVLGLLLQTSGDDAAELWREVER